MTQAEAFDFPFVDTLPKKEKSKFRKVWDAFQELSAITKEKGMLVPVRLGAKIIGISRQRCDELIADGRLEVHDVDGQRFLTENSVIAYARSERKIGRPLHIAATLSEGHRIAKELIAENRSSKSAK